MADENGSGDADAPPDPTADDREATPGSDGTDEPSPDDPGDDATDPGGGEHADTDTEGTPDADGEDPDADSVGSDADGVGSDADGEDPDADGVGSDADGVGPDADGVGPDPADDGPEVDADGWEDTWSDGVDTYVDAADTDAETDTTETDTDTDTDAETGTEAETEAEAETETETGATVEDSPPPARASSEVSTPGVSPAGAAAGGGTGASGGTVAAPDDQEMPLTEHIEEMVTRLGVVIVVMALVSGVVFPFADRLINFLWYSFLPGTVEQCPVTGDPDVACPTLYHPLALMFARLKVASLAGFVIALPLMVYESYLFMRPGLYPRERRYYLASVPTSLVLACVGVLFAYFLVLPVLFQYFTGYTASAAEIAFGLSETFSLIVMMLGFFALVFQIPLLIMLAIMMGVTSRQWLADKRLYFWGGFATIAFIFSPDPTGMAPILVAVTMVGLFEGTLLLLRWTGN